MTVLLHKSRLALADRLADAGLWLMAALHALIALSFLVVLAGLSPARAQDLPTCTGNNLLTKYEKDDPAGYAKYYLDMGWDDIKVAVEYEGDHHRTDRRQFHHDIRRYEEIAELGWITVRVTAEDSRVDVVRRVNDARARRM